MHTKSLDVVNQAAAAEYEIGGIAAILGIIGQYVETEEAELQGDELMSLSTQLFRIKRDLKDAVKRFEESGNVSEGLSNLDNALEYRPCPYGIGVTEVHKEDM